MVKYLDEFLSLTIEMAPWLLIGFFFAGLLHVFIPQQKIREMLGGRNLKSVVYAALLGVPLPLCSCGVIPTGISFHKEGASKGATVSFLISTPQTGVDSILATYSLLGLPFALLRPVVAFLSGIAGGVITNFVSAGDTTSQAKDTSAFSRPKQVKNKVFAMLKYAFHDFLMDIAKWLVIGLALAALISLIIPDDFFVNYLHNDVLSMLVVLAASIPVYVCATGSIPIAAVLMMKGLSPGAALVFLMAGPATNLATMAVIGKAIDKKTLYVYLFSIITSALFFGFLTNLFIPEQWFQLSPGHFHHNHELLPHWMKLSAAITLSVLIITGYLTRLIRRKKSKTMNTDISEHMEIITLKVTGMTCNHCKMSAERSMMNVKGISKAIADPARAELYLEGDNINLEEVKQKIEEVGFSYHGKIAGIR